MILKLVEQNNPILHRKAAPVRSFHDASLKQLLADMEETLLFTGGIGLAAPQVGSGLQLFMLNLPQAPKVFINPKITSYAKEIVEMEEGCLSIPGFRGYVPRSVAVEIEYQDSKGKKKTLKATKLLAHALQHESDHLNGILYPDRVTDKSKIKEVVPIRILFFGTPEFSVPLVQALAGLKHSFEYELVGVVTQSDQSPVALAAQSFEIPVIVPPKDMRLSSPKFVEEMKSTRAEVFIVASFGRIIPQVLLDIPKFGSLNVHGSILPRHRGASPIQHAILQGDDITGLTIMLMDAKMDEGPILAIEQMPIEADDTYASLSEKLSLIAPDLTIGTMHSWINGKIKPAAQNEKKATYTKILTKEDGYIDLSHPPKDLDAMIRAYFPWPGVWTRFNGKVLKLLPHRLVQLEGKSPITLDEFKRGYKDFQLDW